MPSQPNGYTLSYAVRKPCGSVGRQMPWKPSQPAITSQFEHLTAPFLRAEANARRPMLEVVNADVRHLEQDLSVVLDALGDEVLHHLVLSVDRDDLAAGEFGQRNAMALVVEAQHDPLVDHALAIHPRTDTDVAQQLGGAHAPSNPRVDDARCNPAYAFSRMTQSMPSRCSRCASKRPEGPAPMIPTCVRMAYQFT